MLRKWLLIYMSAGSADELLSSPAGRALLELLSTLQDAYEYGFPVDVAHAYFALLDQMTDER